MVTESTLGKQRVFGRFLCLGMDGVQAMDTFLLRFFFFLRERTKMFPYDSGFHKVKKKIATKKNLS